MFSCTFHSYTRRKIKHNLIGISSLNRYNIIILQLSYIYNCTRVLTRMISSIERCYGTYALVPISVAFVCLTSEAIHHECWISKCLFYIFYTIIGYNGIRVISFLNCYKMLIIYFYEHAETKCIYILYLKANDNSFSWEKLIIVIYIFFFFINTYIHKRIHTSTNQSLKSYST